MKENSLVNIKFPPPMFIYEDSSSYCNCGSSLKKKFIFFSGNKCINPNCMNYYKGFPSEDYDERWGIYDINGNLK